MVSFSKHQPFSRSLSLPPPPAATATILSGDLTAGAHSGAADHYCIPPKPTHHSFSSPLTYSPPYPQTPSPTKKKKNFPLSPHQHPNHQQRQQPTNMMLGRLYIVSSTESTNKNTSVSSLHPQPAIATNNNEEEERDNKVGRFDGLKFKS